jgi:uncharacterized protein YuzE
MPLKLIRISSHAHFEMQRRRIRLRDVAATIRNPGQILPSAGDCQRRCQSLPCDNHVQNKEDREILEKAVKIIYDKETDTLSIILRETKVAESDEARPGLILDYDKAGRLVSLELLDASEQVKSPRSVEFALAADE